MPELIISSVNDLSKLSGWNIEKAWFDQPTNSLKFAINHIAAANPVVLIIRTMVNFKIEGLSITVNPNINIGTEDKAVG